MLLATLGIFAGCQEASEEEETSFKEVEPTPSEVQDDDDVVTTETEDDLNPTEEVPDDTGESSKPVHLEFFNSYSVAGETETLFSVENTVWSIGRFAGTYSSPAHFDLQKGGDNGFETIASLPEPDQRSYLWTKSVTIDGAPYIVSLYTSNSAFSPQDGTHHGVVILDTAGNLISDHDLYSSLGVTGPSAFAFDDSTQTLYVLVNNSAVTADSTLDAIDFGSSALVEIPDPLNWGAEPTFIPLDGFKNASAMALRDGKLVIAAANNTLDETDGDGKLLTVDPILGSITNILDLPQGVGINGIPEVAANGDIVFTGNNQDGNSMVTVSSDDSLVNFSVPSGFQQYVADATLVGSSLLFNSTQGYETSTLLLMGEEGYEVLNSIPALFGVAPIALGGGVYCDAAAGTGISDDGSTLYSEVTCYQETVP